MPGPTQLPLALPHAPSFTRADFMPSASNGAALRLIESWPDWPSPIVILTGPSGSGKSHLVHIWADSAGAEIVNAANLAPDSAARSAAVNAVAVEDIMLDAVPEAALFHLINSVREHGGSLLMTSRSAAEDWQVSLPDLRSRLRLAAPIALGAPDDGLLRQVLVKLFADRQLIVDKAVIDYLLSRMERSLRAAIAVVEALDGKALSEGRRITRPMAADVLADSAGESTEFADRQ